MYEHENNLIEYSVTADGVIKNVSGDWDSFAIDNDAGILFSESVIGTKLFSHISGNSVKNIYQALHERVLNNPGCPVTYSYRCDSPGLRRSMTMIIVAHGNDITYRSMIINTRKHLSTIKLDYTTNSDYRISMCSLCKRYNLPENSTQWLTFETIFENTPETFTITHSICPDCRDKLESESMRSLWQKSSAY